MATFIFDCHVHFSFKPANSDNYRSGDLPDPDHWRERIRKKADFHWFADFADKTVIKSSQVQGDACTAGVHRVLCNSLYPLERGFIRPALTGPLGTLTGFAQEVLKRLVNRECSYFELLKTEYDNLLLNAGDNQFADPPNKYRVAATYSQIKDNLAEDRSIISVFNSVEGAHAFADDILVDGEHLDLLAAEKRHILSLGQQGPGDPDFTRFIDAVKRNIKEVKTWSHAPFFVTLSHHYYNHLAGHAPSLTTFVDLISNQDGATIEPGGQILNFYYTGLHPWCYDILDTMLDASAGSRRMLVDVKHMSPQARTDYYEYLRQRRKRRPGERIPIVKSHTAVSGRFDIARTIANEHRLFRKERKRSRHFYNGIINLFDDEISEIVKSDGLIGLMIDERRIMGRKLTPESTFSKKRELNSVAKKSKRRISSTVKLKHRIQWLQDDLAVDPGNSDLETKLAKAEADLLKSENEYRQFAERLKPAYLSVLFRQIFHILDICGETGWDHLCLGTDYDGVINPIDTYKQCQDMRSFENDLVVFWNKMLQSNICPDLYSRHLYNRSPEWWVSKLLCLNGMNFLKKYYTAEYLEQGISPAPGWQLTAAEESLFTGIARA